MELRHRQADAKARNGLQFVERPAGVAQPATADHRNVQAGGGNQRRQHQRSLVTHAAGGVLVHFLRWKKREVKHLARVQHGVGQGSGLLAGHPAQHDRHQPSRDLIVRDVASRSPVH